MHKLLLSTLFLLFISCGGKDSFSVECLPASLQSGVVAFYSFNNGSLADDSPNSNNLSNTTTAKPTSDRAGNPTCAYLFTNNSTLSEYITNSSTGFLNGLNDFSISIWYQPIDPTRDGGDYEILVSRGDAPRCPDRRGEWSVGLYDCRRAVFGHNNSVWANLITPLPGNCQDEIDALTDNWQHVVAIKNGNTYTLYFNGVLDETETGNASCSNLYLAQDIGDLYLGKYYTGKLDDILIYNRALTQAEVTSLFNLEACCQ